MDPKSVSTRSQKIQKYMVEPAIVAGKTQGASAPTKEVLNEIDQYLAQHESEVSRRQTRDRLLTEMFKAGIPKTFGEAVGKSAAVGLTDVATIGTGLVSSLPGVGEKVRPVHEAIVSANNRASRQVDEYYPDVNIENPLLEGAAVAGAQGAARFPKMWSRVAQEVYSPVSKVTAPASVAANFPRLANLINTYGVDAVNAAWHAARGGSKGGAEGALVSSTGQLIGEKGIEPLAEAAIARFLPRFSKAAQAASGVGNVGGMASEELYYAGKNAFAPETR
jgi:hypothetical protein